MNGFEFYWSYKDFVIRSVQSRINSLPYLELTAKCANSDARFTLATYHWDKEGGGLHFIGNRPLEHISEIDVTPIWKQLWLACKMLQDWYEKEYDNIHA